MRASTATSSARAGNPCANRVRVTHASKSSAGLPEASCGAIALPWSLVPFLLPAGRRPSGRFLVSLRGGIAAHFGDGHLGVPERCTYFINEELVYGALVTALGLV